MSAASLRRKLDHLLELAEAQREPTLLNDLNPIQRSVITNWYERLKADAEDTPEGLYALMLEQEWSPLDQFIKKMEKYNE